MKKISVIVPIYNEESVIEIFNDELNKQLTSIKEYSFEIVYINDGSEDNSLNILKKINKTYQNIVIINLSRNFGHDAAINAGIDYCKGDAAIIMDGDLQDSPEFIKDLLNKFEDGYDVVNAKRIHRECDSFKKRFTAKIFYKLISHWSYRIKIVENVNNFRLISKRVINVVKNLNNKNKVFRFDVPFAGFKTCNIDISRYKRVNGSSHYSLKNMSRLAIDSIVSVSTQPLNLISKIFLFFSFIFSLNVLTQIILFSITKATGLVAISDSHYLLWLIVNIITLLFLVILFSIAIVAQYIARIHIETQNRPIYIIDKIIETKKEK